jgi:hypothetical protein
MSGVTSATAPVILDQCLQVDDLQKELQTCFVAPGQKCIMGGILTLLHPEATQNSNSGTSDKTWCI